MSKQHKLQRPERSDKSFPTSRLGLAPLFYQVGIKIGKKKKTVETTYCELRHQLHPTSIHFLKSFIF